MRAAEARLPVHPMALISRDTFGSQGTASPCLGCCEGTVAPGVGLPGTDACIWGWGKRATDTTFQKFL